MSAWLSGTRPSSGVRDSRGVPEQAGAGPGVGKGQALAGSVRSQGGGGSGGSGWEESVSRFSGAFLALERAGLSKIGSRKPKQACGGGGAGRA